MYFYSIYFENNIFWQTQETTPDILYVKDTLMLLEGMKNVSPVYLKDTRPNTYFIDAQLDGHTTPPHLDTRSESLQKYLCRV